MHWKRFSGGNEGMDPFSSGLGQTEAICSAMRLKDRLQNSSSTANKKGSEAPEKGDAWLRAPRLGP